VGAPSFVPLGVVQTSWWDEEIKTQPQAKTHSWEYYDIEMISESNFNMIRIFLLL
jgi:hypothetical protein